MFDIFQKSNLSRNIAGIAMQLVDNLLQLMLFSYIMSAREVIIMLFSFSEHQHSQLMKAHSLLKTILFSSFVIIKASRLAIRA